MCGQHVEDDVEERKCKHVTEYSVPQRFRQIRARLAHKDNQM